MAVTADNPEPNARPGDQGWTRPRAAAWVAVPLGSLNAAFSLLSLLLAGLAGWSLSRYLGNYTLAASILAASYSVVGALIASLRPRNPLGWIFLAVGFSQGFEQFAGTYAEYALVTNPGSSLPDGALMSWLSAFTWVPGLSLAITFVPLLFPTEGCLLGAGDPWRGLARCPSRSSWCSRPTSGRTEGGFLLPSSAASSGASPTCCFRSCWCAGLPA